MKTLLGKISVTTMTNEACGIATLSPSDINDPDTNLKK